MTDIFTVAILETGAVTVRGFHSITLLLEYVRRKSASLAMSGRVAILASSEKDVGEKDEAVILVRKNGVPYDISLPEEDKP